MPMNLKDYPADWKAISLRIRGREGWRCKWCKAPNHRFIIRTDGSKWRNALDLLVPYLRHDDENERNGYARDWDSPHAIARDLRENGHRVSYIVLTVAHLGTPHADGSPGDKHDKMDVRDENLAALCQRCHLFFDMADHVRYRKYGRGVNQLALLSLALLIACSNEKALPVLSDEAPRAVVGEVATATTLPDSSRASESVGDSTLGMVPGVRVMAIDIPPAHSGRTPKELLDPLTPKPHVMSPTEAVTNLQRTAVVASQQGYRIKGGLAAFSAFGIWFRSGYPFDQVVVFDWLLNGRRTTYARVQWLDGAMQGVRTDLILCGFKSPDAVGVKARHVSNGVSVAVLDMEGTP